MAVHTPLNTEPYVILFAYQISVHNMIHVKRLMNKHRFLSCENMASENTILKSAFNLFIKWKYERVRVMSQLNMKKSEAIKFFLAKQMFENMLQHPSECMADSSSLLIATHPDDIKFIPGLHSIQSSLEKNSRV